VTVIPMMKPPNKREAQDIIRKLAAEGQVFFHPHIRKAKRRKITTLQILNCLKKGQVDEEPTQNFSHKGWQTAIVAQIAGARLRVVVCLRWSQDALVITAYYD